MNIYVLSNPSMPGLVKIGRSAFVEGRVSALSGATGVPLPFVVEYEQFVGDDDSVVELAAHRALAEFRVNASREFFRVSPDVAIERVQVAALMSAWNRATAEARLEFLERIEQPVFDRGAA